MQNIRNFFIKSKPAEFEGQFSNMANISEQTTNEHNGWRSLLRYSISWLWCSAKSLFLVNNCRLDVSPLKKSDSDKTVLGLLLFLCHINDFTTRFSSPTTPSFYPQALLQFFIAYFFFVSLKSESRIFCWCDLFCQKITLCKEIHVQRNDSCPTVILPNCACVKQVLSGWKLIFG